MGHAIPELPVQRENTYVWLDFFVVFVQNIDASRGSGQSLWTSFLLWRLPLDLGVLQHLWGFDSLEKPGSMAPCGGSIPVHTTIAVHREAHVEPPSLAPRFWALDPAGFSRGVWSISTQDSSCIYILNLKWWLHLFGQSNLPSTKDQENPCPCENTFSEVENVCYTCSLNFSLQTPTSLCFCASELVIQ